MVTTEALRDKWATPAMLTQERERMGLEVVDAAREIGVPPAELRAWEEGEALPTLADLRRLADLYLCPVGYFFTDGRQTQEEKLDFRGLDETKSLSYESRKNSAG